MGGNNFKELDRIDRCDVYEITKSINEKLKHMNLDLRLTKSINEKSSFGDLDFLTQNQVYNPRDIQCFLKEYETKVNGNMISIAFRFNEKFYQIDIIFVKNIEFAEFIYSYHVIGYFLGSWIKHLNLSLNNDYIYFKFSDLAKDLNIQVPQIVLVTDVQELCNFLNLNYERWLAGFNNMQELSEWLKECNVKFKINVMNDKKCNKRKAFQDISQYFLEEFECSHCKQIPDKGDYCDSISVKETVKFFNKKDEFDEITRTLNETINLKNKFSRELFKKHLPKNEMNNVGNYFTKFKNTKHNLNEWIEKTDVVKIENEVKEFIDFCLTKVQI